MNLKSYIIYLMGATMIFGGCATHKNVAPKYNKRINHTSKPLPAAYSYPRVMISNSGSKVYDPYAIRGIHKPKISRSLSELDRDSRSVKPTLVYSKPVRNINYSTRSIDISPYKSKILSYINSLRATGGTCGAPTHGVRWSSSLENAASAHAGDMATNNFLGHMGSGGATDLARKANGRGSNFYERIMRFGYPIQGGGLAGEVVTYTKDSVVGNADPYFHFIHAMDNFQRSARHCSIIMNPRFQDVGVSAYRGNDKTYWVIEFAQGSNR